MLTWHQAWQAEAAGDLERAERKYADSFGYDGAMVGAECNRIRLLAAHPDRQALATAALDKLLQHKGAAPEVAVTGVFAAMTDKQPELAAKRLAAARRLTPEDLPGLRGAVAAAQIAVAAGSVQPQEFSAQAAAALPTDATAVHEMAAVLAWNRGDSATAARFAQSSGELAAWLAVQRGDFQRAAQVVLAIPEAARSATAMALLGWARAQLGDIAGAQAASAAAVARDPLHPVVTQVWAAVALLAGQPTIARDALVGLLARRPTAAWAAWFDLGVAQLKLGDPAAAFASFDRAVALCPTCQAAVKNRDLVGKLGR